MNFRVIEHTADIGIEVEAPSLRELFEGAAEAMMHIISPKASKPETPKSISLDAEDIEALLYSWLNEILFIVFSEGIIPSVFKVESINERALKAEMSGELYSPGKLELQTEIKGATFHGMYVVEKDGTWTARVIFDV
ncbi:MAG: archease [Actinobacteria bacterium]|nr:archease [Actinomycetota bacterium]